jgi:hypothetical protein
MKTSIIGASLPPPKSPIARFLTGGHRRRPLPVSPPKPSIAIFLAGGSHRRCSKQPQALTSIIGAPPPPPALIRRPTWHCRLAPPARPLCFATATAPKQPQAPTSIMGPGASAAASHRCRLAPPPRSATTASFSNSRIRIGPSPESERHAGSHL